jgi:Glyoxalase-like domain
LASSSFDRSPHLTRRGTRRSRLPAQAYATHRLASFWAALLEREVRPGDMPRDDSVLVVAKLGLLFLRVPEGKTAKNRIHFDVWPLEEKRDWGVARALELGATMLADMRRPDGTGWVWRGTRTAPSGTRRPVIGITPNDLELRRRG